MSIPSTSRGEAPLFVGDWDSLGMIHLEVPPTVLQPTVPFELDLFEGHAFVSLVFFTMRNMRLANAPRLLNMLFHPFRDQRFLNVRTYVRCNGEPGIHFIREWISSRLCVHLGPVLYALPYRWGKHHTRLENNVFRASVSELSSQTALVCEMRLLEGFGPCRVDSLDEFLFERYAAFNAYGGRGKQFRVRHAPWQQCRCEAVIADDSLLRVH